MVRVPLRWPCTGSPSALTDEDMAQIAKLNQHDMGTINFGDPQFVKYLIENYG